MSKEKLDQLFDNTVRDTLIENLERRQLEIIEETERYLASERSASLARSAELPDDEPDEDYDAGESDDYAGDFEEDEEIEDWNDV